MSDVELTKYKLSPPDPRGAFSNRAGGGFVVVRLVAEVVDVTVADVAREGKLANISVSTVQSWAIRRVGGMTVLACCSDRCRYRESLESKNSKAGHVVYINRRFKNSNTSCHEYMNWTSAS